MPGWRSCPRRRLRHRPCRQSYQFGQPKVLRDHGIDINEGMLTAARRNPQIAWHQGSATELPFAEGTFDVVLCQQGLQQYFPDRDKAMKEMARVLAPGGRIALNVWGALERQPFFMALVDAIA